MVIGRTIQIYLPDGNPRSIKVCDINTSFVKGILIPRNKLKDVAEFEDLTLQGVYFLITDIEEVLTFSIYVGEAENVGERLKQHDRHKDDWNKAIVFLSSKNNLNKAHCKFLESYCHAELKVIDRFRVDNVNVPSSANLTPADRDLALHFFEDMKIIMGTLGFPIFEEIKNALPEEIFYCRGKGAEAKGNLTEDGFVVFKGSSASLVEVPSAQDSYITRLRDNLKEKGILFQHENKLVFTKDYVFSSPSTSAAVILGRSSNGWSKWKNSKGKTLDEVKRGS